MPHDVFISYATKDKTTADAVCFGLEKEGIRCWIAPRDILPSDNYDDSIIHAIDTSRVSDGFPVSVPTQPLKRQSVIDSDVNLRTRATVLMRHSPYAWRPLAQPPTVWRSKRPS